MLEYDSLLNLMNNEDWEQQLEEKGISINWDNNYVILSYRFLSCDFNDPVVRACRGIILKKEDDSFKIVCAPFIKFAYGEDKWEKPIDWNSAKVREKIDGSLMKAFYDDGWKLATNGVINAFNAHLDDERLVHSFGELFEYAIQDKFENWAENLLDKNFTYMFELATPYNRVVIPYKDSKVWYLSRRNIHTLKEDDSDIPGLIRPKLYNLTSIYDVTKLVREMIDEEGVVIYDKDFNRLKSKSDDYLIKHGLAHNKVITLHIVINMIISNSVDDYLAYFGDDSGFIKNIVDIFNNKVYYLNNKWNELVKNNCDKLSAKEFAAIVKEIPNSDFLFYKFNGGEFDANDYILTHGKRYIERLVNSNE